jgi:hypothetical protein
LRALLRVTLRFALFVFLPAAFFLIVLLLRSAHR